MFHFHWNYIFELFCVFFFLIRKKRTSGIFLDYSFSSSHCDQELRKVLPCNEFFLTAFASCKKAIWAPKWINGSLLINKEKKKKPNKRCEYWRCLWSKAINMWIVGNCQDRLLKLKFLAYSLSKDQILHSPWKPKTLEENSVGKPDSQF